MDLVRNKFLLFPFFVILLAYLTDKILLSERIQTYFSKTMSEINYIHKEELYEELKSYLNSENRRKVFVYFGTSRALLFELQYIESTYRDWTMFNFSVPGATPDYSLYWLERFEKDGVRPDFVLLDQSIEAYNTAASISLDDVLTNGLSIPFVLRHCKHYSRDQIATLIAKRLFKTYHYRPKLSTIQERIRNDSAVLKSYRKLRQGLLKQLREERGSAKTPGAAGGIMTSEKLKQSSWGDFHSYLVPFYMTKAPMYFLGKSYDILRKMDIAHAAIWVRISRPYWDLIRTYPVAVSPTNEKKILYDYWYPQLIEFQNLYGVEIWNMNEDSSYSCDLFSDSGHMSPACYKDYTDYIFRKIQGMNFNK